MDPRRDGDAPPDGLRRRRGRDYDEVDARIAIPLATSAPGPRQVLQSGINKYRSLSGGRPPALVVPGAALNAPPPEPRTSSSSKRRHHHATTSRDEPLEPAPSALELAQRLVAQKQFAAAIPYFSEALTSSGSGSGSQHANASVQHQSRLRVFYERGSCYLAAQRYPQAIEDFSRVITLTPKNPQLFAKRARAYAQLQQHAAALSDYHEAIELATAAAPGGAEPNSATLRALYLARARVFAATKDSQSALQDLALAEAVGGARDAELFLARAYVRLERHEPALALADFDRFLELQDDNDDVVDMSGVRAADEALERAHDVRFERAKLLETLAAAQDAKHATDAALDDIEQGGAEPTAEPTAPTTGTGTGYRSAEAVALVVRAVDDYTLLLELEPASLNVAEILLRRAEALGRIGRVDDALDDLARAQKLSPSDFEIRLTRAKLFQRQRDLARAIDEVTAVLQLNGFFLDALFLRAALYVESGDRLKAQRDYTSIVDAHYDSRSEAYSDVGSAVAPTEKTPLLSKANGSSSSSSSGKPATSSKSPSQAATATATMTPKPTRFLSPFSKKALLLRARLWVEMNQFDDAIADYEQLQLSSANEIDAQVELQDARLKQAAFVEQERLAAEASLLQGEDQERLEAEAKRTASASSKKKKKKKAKKKRRPTPSESGYVLLPDEEDDEQTGSVGRNDDDDADVIEVVVVDSEPETPVGEGDQLVETSTATTTVTTTATMTTEATVTTTVVETTPAPVVRVSGSGGVVTMTREEAFESMWEDDQADGETVERELAAVAHVSLTANQRSHNATTVGATGARAHEEVDEDDDSSGVVSARRVGESGDEAIVDTSSSSDPVAGAAAVREVIVDEKYLRKRQRQLENLRSDLRHACAARDRAAIAEVLERAERKQMTDALGDEIRHAQAVLEKLATDVASDDSDDSGRAGDTIAVCGNQEAVSLADGLTKVSAEPHQQQGEESVAKPTAANARPASEAPPPLAAEPTADADAVVAPVSTAKPLVTKRSLRNAQVPTSAVDADPSVVAPTTPTMAGKPPSLVIRPIAYSHALQLAEQSQHQFLQTQQRLLQEKDAEIASLRQLVAQFRRKADASSSSSSSSSELTPSRLATLRSQFPHKPLRELESRVEVLVHWMGPSEDADHARHRVLAFVYHVLEAATAALGSPLLVFPTGSFPMKTYLPTADLDVCLFLPKELEPTWHLPVLHALCLAGTTTTSSSSSSVGQIQQSGPSDTAGGSGPSSHALNVNGSPTPKLSDSGGGAVGSGLASASATGVHGFPSPTVRNVNFINADVRVIKCTVDNVSVDVTVNRTGALGALQLLDAMDARVGKKHLLKKSLILIKAWCIHESGAYTATTTGATMATGATAPMAGHSVMGSSYGAFSTYAVNTAVMGLFNQFGARLTHPLQALFLFLDRMADFPWHDAAMTMHGPVALSALASASSLGSVLKKRRSGGRKGSGGDVSTTTATTTAASELHQAKMSWDDVELLRMRTHEQFGAFDASSSSSSATGGGFKTGVFPIRVCNIVDPLDEKNNLARSVSVDWFPSMKRAFRLGRDRLAELLLTAEKGGSGGGGGSKRVDELDDFFANSWRTYGRGDGWRPDLLVHPRQVWHGKATTAYATGPSDHATDDELRWQSLLPELVLPMAAGPYQPQGQTTVFYPQPLYVAHHPQQQQPQSHHPHHHHHHPHPYQHQMGTGGSPHGAGGGGGALGLTSEPLPYQPQPIMYHRRSFDNSGSKSSPLKPGPMLRHHQQTPTSSHQLSPGPGTGGPSYGLSGGTPKVARRYESPPAASHGLTR